jgi:hypothetical protein
MRQTNYQAYDFSSVIFCHIPESSPTIVAWVIKSTPSMECLVFDCLTSAKALALYQSFDEQSRALKLDKYRSLKKGSALTSTAKPMSSLSVPKNADGSMNMKIDGRNICVSVNNVIVEKRGKNQEVSMMSRPFAFLRRQSNKDKRQKPWSLVQHTDENGVTHIEIENGGASHKSLCDIVLTSTTLGDDDDVEPCDDGGEHSSIISISAPDPEPYRSLDSISMGNWATPMTTSAGGGQQVTMSTTSGGESGDSRQKSVNTLNLNKPRQRKPAMLIRAPKASSGEFC